MRASLRGLLAGAWLALAGVSAASAQGDPVVNGTVLQGCGPVCRLFHETPAPANTPQPQAQPAQPPLQLQTQNESPRRSRRTATRKVQRAAGAEEQGASEGARERRSRAAVSRAGERASRKAESAGSRPATRAAAVDVEQTASVSQRQGEILFVSGADEAHRSIAGDLAGVAAPDLAVRTVPGKGLPLRDILALPGADVTVTSSLTLARGSAYADKVVYLTKLFTEEIHAVAGSGVTRLEDLDGQPVHLGPPDSDSEAAARAFLQARGISVTPAGGSFASALAEVRAGRIAAAFILAPKPFAPLAELSPADGLRLLPLAYRSSDEAFHPASLSAADYPGLIGAGERVETVALDAVLVAPRWREETPRQRELAAFTTRLFEGLGALGERHPKWKETNLATGVEGFVRLKAAQQWVAARLKGGEASVGGAGRDSRLVGEAR